MFFGSLALEDKTGVKQSSVNPLEEASFRLEPLSCFYLARQSLLTYLGSCHVKNSACVNVASKDARHCLHCVSLTACICPDFETLQADSCSCGAELLQGQIDKATVPLCAVPAKLLELASSKARDLKESRVHSIAAASNQPQTPLLTPILRQASLNTSAFMQPECPLPQAVYMDASVTQAAAGLLDKTKLNEALSSTGALVSMIIILTFFLTAGMLIRSLWS